MITDTMGNVLNQRTYFYGGLENFRSILTLSNNDLIFIGTSESFDKRGDFFVVRTDSALNSPPIGIMNQENKVPDLYLLYQNYPNPFNSSTKIKVYINNVINSNDLKLRIFDVNGKTINEFSFNNLSSRTFEFIWKPVGISTGIYFYSLCTENKVLFSKKMLLIQ